MKEDKSGFVYVMAKESSPSYFKVGRTERKPQLRALELDGTDSPTPSIVVYFAYCDNCELLEYSAHQVLDSVRVRQNREWFKCNLNEAIDAIQEAAKNNLIEIHHEKLLLDEYEDGDILGGASLDDGTGEAKAIHAINSIFPVFSRRDDELIRYKSFLDARLEELRKKEIAGEDISSLKSMAESAYYLKRGEIDDEMNLSLKKLIEGYKERFGFSDSDVEQLHEISEIIKSKNIKQFAKKGSQSAVPKGISKTLAEYIKNHC